MIVRKKRSKTTSDRTKLYADLLLTFSMCATGIIMGLPITDNHKLWIVAGINFIGMGGKLLTNVVEFKKKIEVEPDIHEEPTINQ